MLRTPSWSLSRARLVRHDAGQAFIHALEYRGPCAASACGIATKKSSKSGKYPTLWNIQKGNLLQRYQLSREVTGVSRTDIGAITTIAGCHSTYANQPSGIAAEACELQERT
jgi:hypothetical protein